MNKQHKYLYIQPKIFIPYEISLRKKDSVKLKRISILNGDEIPVDDFDPKPKRMLDKNYIYFQFNKAIYIDVESLDGDDDAITLTNGFEINFQNQDPVKVIHRQHIGVQKKGRFHPRINQFTTLHATPALFGLGSSSYREKFPSKILKFGLWQGKPNTWAIESLDLIYPNTEIQHGILQ